MFFSLCRILELDSISFGVLKTFCNHHCLLIYETKCFLYISYQIYISQFDAYLIHILIHGFNSHFVSK